MNILKQYELFCKKKDILFEDIQSVKSPDNTTLFCTAGMQQFKPFFSGDKEFTIATNQHCLRVDDISQVGDGIHFSDFNMLGLFSFHRWNMSVAVSFWLEFMDKIGVTVDEAHIPPEREEWRNLYPDKIKVVIDGDCKWSDGKIGGFCTEFYSNGVEIGNIVNTLGDCIDVGFGLERLDKIVNKTKDKSREQLLANTCLAIIEAGYKPSNKLHGYVLRKLLRELKNSTIDIPYLKEEKERQARILKKYEKLKSKFPDKSKEWWFDTHGIEV